MRERIERALNCPVTEKEIHFHFNDRGMILNTHCLKKDVIHLGREDFASALMAASENSFPPKKKQTKEESHWPPFRYIKVVGVFHTSRTTPLLSAPRGARLPPSLNAIHSHFVR